MIKFTKAVSATTLVIALAACSNNTDTSNNTFENSDTYGSNSVSVMSHTNTIIEVGLNLNPFIKPWENP